MRRFAISAVVVGLAVVGIAQAVELTEASKEALVQLKGNWQAISIEHDGEVDDDPVNFPLISVEDDKLLLNREDVGLRITAVDGASSPAAVDISHTETGGVIECIYELTDDTWRVCRNMDAHGVRERPTAFKTNAGGKFWVVTYKRLAE